MRKLFNNLPVRSALLLVAIFCVAFFYIHRWKGLDGNGWEATIDGDSKGAYAYLPAYFIYHDPSFSFFDKPQNKDISRYYHERFKVQTSYGTVNKNYIGVAFLISPFFVVGHLLAHIVHQPLTGYSWPYMLMVGLGAIFYLVLGLHFLSKLLRSFSISTATTVVMLCLVALGTNLLYYTSIHCVMPHVYSFSMIAAFCYYVRMLSFRVYWRHLFSASCLLGIIVIIRPVNLIILSAVPFLIGSIPASKEILRTAIRLPGVLASCVLIFVAVLIIQLLSYKLQTGYWFVWSYGNEGFVFSRPRFYQVLFGFRKGFFIYTPLMFISVLSGIYLLIKNKWSGLLYYLFVIVITYVISSWWNWYYGDGFGLRPFIDFYSVLILPLAILLNAFKRNILLNGLLLLLTIYNVIQVWQYRYRIIHPSDMNEEKYAYSFLKLSRKYSDKIGGNTVAVYEKIETMPYLKFSDNCDSASSQWDHQGVRFEPEVKKSVLVLNKDIEYGDCLRFNGDILKYNSENVFVRGTFSRYELEEAAGNEVFLVISVDDTSGKSKYWSAYMLNDFPRKEIKIWRKTTFNFRMPKGINSGDIIKFYFWNPQHKNILVDDIRYRFYEIN